MKCHVVVGLACALAAPAVRAEGIAFGEGPLAPVLEQARREKQRVFVEVWASWCSPCKRQRAEVFDTPEGAALAQGMIAWRADFDAPENQALMEEWAVLQLPTVLVLKPDGTEVDRIEGYERREEFLVDARRIARGEDALPLLQRRLLVSKDANERACLEATIAHKQLVRRDVAPALATLERLASSAPTPVGVTCGPGRGSAAEDALSTTGRYLSRVKHDASRARYVWRELATRFPTGVYARTADWWYASALHDEGLDGVAIIYLARRARETSDPVALDNVVAFAVEKSGDRTSARVVLDELEKTSKLRAVDIAKQRARLANPNPQKTGT